MNSVLGLGLEKRIDYIWGILKEYREDSEELYEYRYRNLLQGGRTATRPGASDNQSSK